ncbi:MAG: lysylphosphatidylglycerol synthase transmembrane domain-containing protein [Myxococcota bacterium]
MVKFTAKLAATAGLLYLIARGIDFAQIATLTRTSDAALVAWAVLATVALNAVKPLRWMWLLRCVLERVGYLVALRSHLFAAGARMILPGKLGEFGRILAVPRLSISAGTGLTVMDLLMDMATACLLAAPGMWFFAGPLPGVAVAVVAGLCLLTLLRPHAALAAVTRLPGLRRLAARADVLSRVPRHLDGGVLARGLTVSLILHALRFVQLYILLGAVGASPQLMALLCLPMIQLADGVAITFGGIGGREWLGMHILPRYGVTAEMAVAAIFLQFAISNLLPGLAGAWIIARDRHSAAAKLRGLLSGGQHSTVEYSPPQSG